MDNENMNTQTEATQADTQGDKKTFTQDDVNRIVQDRLAKDRAKASEEISRREQELAQREFRLNSRQKLLDRGLPESILDALNCSSETAFDKALETIDSLIRERTPAAGQAELEKNRARFTAPISKASSGGEDPIRKAMNL